MNPTPSLAALRTNPLPRAMRPPGARLGDLAPAEHVADRATPPATASADPEAAKP